MVLFGWHTGARPAEITRLTTGEIDQTGDIWIAALEKHKTAGYGHTREIPIGRTAQNDLAPMAATWRTRRADLSAPCGWTIARRSGRASDAREGIQPGGISAGDSSGLSAGWRSRPSGRRTSFATRSAVGSAKPAGSRPLRWHWGIASQTRR